MASAKPATYNRVSINEYSAYYIQIGGQNKLLCEDVYTMQLLLLIEKLNIWVPQ